MVKALAVDDDEAFRKILKAVLEGEGYEVHTAENGKVAQALLGRESFEIVISDIRMPETDGLSLLSYIQREHPRLPVILMTGLSRASETEEAIHQGARAFLPKPFRREELLQAIETAKSALPRLVPFDQSADDLFRRLVESLELMVWATRPDGEAEYANQLWKDYTGLTLAMGNDGGWAAAFHAEELAGVKAAWTRALASGQPYAVEARLRHRDGSYRWWQIRGLPLRDERGLIARWVGTCTDIDQLKTSQQKSRGDEETIRNQLDLINQAQDAILIKDLNGVVKFWNKGAERLYGWTSAEAVGRKTSELYVVDPKAYQESLQRLLREGHWEGVMVKQARGGARVRVDARLTLSRGANGVPQSILSISTDLTEKEKLQNQAFRAQRMESIGTLAGGIAHDLNNVLGPIVLAIELLREGETSAKRLATLETVDLCARRGAEMIGKLMTFARGVDGERKELSPRRLLQDVEAIAGDTFLKSIQIKLKVPAELWGVSGDMTQLHQVLLNLCVNARDAMPAGGALTLSGENFIVDERAAATWGDCPPGQYVLLAVEDTGTGMSREVLDRAFEPFFTTKELGRGTGLGLSTSLAIVKSHGGFVRVYSVEGQGSIFRVYLPRLERKSDEAAVTPAPARVLPRGAGERILVVDDEAAIRQFVGQILELFGYRVRMAESGAEALAIFGQENAGIDLVLTDLMMPLMDGRATIRELRERDPGVRVIATSGLSTSLMLAGERYSLAKPFTAEGLLTCVQRALSGTAP